MTNDSRQAYNDGCTADARAARGAPCTSDWPRSFRIRRRRAPISTSTGTSSAWRPRPSRSASSPSGASSTTSPTTRCARTSSSSSPTWPDGPSAPSSARWSWCSRGTIPCASPESMPIMARLGVGILVIPQKPWPEVAKELDAYRTTYRDINRTEAPPPVCAGWTFCDENPARAHEMARRYIGGYYQTVLDHYNFQGDHLAKTKGYEYYGKMAEKIAQYGTDKVIEYFMNLQVWGTPEQCYEKILDVRGRVGNDTFVSVFSYAGMDYGEAERNMRLFARTVTPELKKLPPAAASAPAAAAPRAGKDLGVGLLGS